MRVGMESLLASVLPMDLEVGSPSVVVEDLRCAGGISDVFVRMRDEVVPTEGRVEDVVEAA